jgi:predicted nucleic acid-binding protein
VYYEQRNNGNIAQKKAAYFLEHIRSTYNIRTQVFDEEFITTLSQKSGAKPELVKDLANQITHVNITSQISDNELIDLNRNIEQFYIQSR